MPHERRSHAAAMRALLVLLGAALTGCTASLPTPRQIPPPAPDALADSPPPLDPMLRRTSQAPGDLPAALPDVPAATFPTAPIEPAEGGQSLALDAALYGALTGNPDLVALRQNAPATAEAVEVARRWPTTLNPTVWLDVRPFNYARSPLPGLDQKDFYINASYRQPIELGNQTKHRYAIARAFYDQTRWSIVQAEVLALVQTYRTFETAAYRREKLKLAEQIDDFNERLVDSLRRALEENLVPAADVRIAEVELSALRQQTEAARQDYATALADLRNQLGQPETAGTAEPFGEFSLPPYIPELEDERLIQLALQSRPEIGAARAQVEGAAAAVRLAEGDRIPTVVVGPEYQRGETGTNFYGFIAVIPLPVVNNGAPLVRQRQAELQRFQIALRQVEQRTEAQVRAAVQRWNAARSLVTATSEVTADLQTQIDGLNALFQENQVDIARLLQARQRLIQLENAKLDAIWQATQAQADLLIALGAPNLLHASRNPAEAGE